MARTRLRPGTQGRTRRPGRSPTPQVHAPVEITAHEWRSKMWRRKAPFQTRHSSNTRPRDRPAGRPAGEQGRGTPASERADASDQDHTFV